MLALNYLRPSTALGSFVIARPMRKDLNASNSRLMVSACCVVSLSATRVSCKDCIAFAYVYGLKI